MTSLWTTDGTWLRCALHAHTTRSAAKHLPRRHERNEYDVQLDGEAIEVLSSPCRSVTLVSRRAAGAAVNVGRVGYRHAGPEIECDRDGLVVHARLDVPPSARHVRIEVTDAARRKVWPNPLPV